MKNLFGGNRKPMLTLGDFLFSANDNTPYEEITHTSDGGWIAIDRYGQKPISQNTGQRLNRISITGTWFYYKVMENIIRLRKIQSSVKPLLMTSGGWNLGFWTIKNLEDRQERIIHNGIAMVIKFAIDLEEYVYEDQGQTYT